MRSIKIFGREFHLSDWGGVFGILIIGSVLALISFFGYVRIHMKTEEATAYIEKKVTVQTVDIDRWSTIRKYDRNSVPTCAWDSSRQWECDRYEKICERRDSLNNCVSYRRGKCIEGHYEYDFSEKGWKNYRDWSKHFTNEPPNEDALKAFDYPDKYAVNVRYSYYIVVQAAGQRKKIGVSSLPSGNKVRVVRREISKKILKLAN